jgi:putative membrane-bound dehydrogenase-like protein
LAAWGVTAFLAALVLPESRRAVAQPDQRFTVADGFVVEQVAAPPLVDRPIVADFDDEGRLYVADSSGSNDKPDVQVVDRPHRIVRLEDTNGDGRFDRSVVFADRMMLPEGTMWFDGSLYVAAPPSIWKLTDTNGDGVADVREEWFQGKTLTGCANDLHGPYLGNDGWIYWTKGAFAEQTYERAGQPPLVTKAAHVFRRRPGGGAIETVLTGGMDNPVDVAFTSAGERIVTSTFIEHPQEGRRDGVIHAIYGGVYGKPHAVIDGHPRTGDLMPELLGLGPAVPAGLTRAASPALGSGSRETFFAALFNLRKVIRVGLEPAGSTFKATPVDFLVSSSRDFHPTDVIEDADGSLLVLDTGPWYKLCCPTSQLAKPDVTGAIYRVRPRNAKPVADPRGLKIEWKALSAEAAGALLDDARPSVRSRVLRTFSHLGSAAVPALARLVSSTRSTEARLNAVWALTRIDGEAAREAVRRALADRDAGVRQAAAHSAGLWRDTSALPGLLDLARSPAPALQRAAAEALGRIGDARAVQPILEVAAGERDRILEHSLTYALIEIGDAAATAAGLRQPSPPRARRAALLALDQMRGGRLDAGAVVALLDSPDPVLNSTAWWIAGRHPEWGGELAAFFSGQLRAPATAVARRADLTDTLGRFADNASIRPLLAEIVREAPSAEARTVALGAMAATRAKELPALWIAPLVQVLRAGDDDTIVQALRVVRAAPAPADGAAALQDALLRLGNDRSRSSIVRLDALASVRGGLARVDAEPFRLLLTSIESASPLPVRTMASTAIETATLDRAQLLALAAALERAGPLELPRLLRAFDASADETVGLAMVRALSRAVSRATLRPDVLRPRIDKYPESVRREGAALLVSLQADAAQDTARLAALQASLGAGDRRRGQDVFNGQKAACSSCHTIGYIGGRIGPDLTSIGRVRSERDLLESIVFPSASFARGFEPVVVTLQSGETRIGVLRTDARDYIVLATGLRDETRIPRDEIRDLQPASVSLMPPGLADQLTSQELADLLAFLLGSVG